MQIVTMATGIACLFAVLLDAFQTIILPRRATGRYRLTSIFYRITWRPWTFFVRRLGQLRRRESAFSYYGPMSLIFLLAIWAGVLVVGFALIFYALGSPFNDAAHAAGLRSDLYVSGTTIFTLGLGDVTPHNGWARAPGLRPPRRSCCAATPMRAERPRSRCCWWSGNAGRRSCWRATSRILCCATSVRSTAIRAG